MMKNVNVVTDYGAVGHTFSTTGNIMAGSQLLTIMGPPLPSGVVIGSGLGIQGAGASDSLSAPYFPAPSLRATITMISGNQVTLSVPAGATVNGAMVSVDDSLPIQQALDDVGAKGGGTVTVPAGTYVIGTPGAKDNTPLFVSSNTIIAGEGRDVTVFQCCDRAAQISLGLNSADSGIVPDAGYQYPCASLIVNKANVWWHDNKSWNLSDPLADAYITPDHDITLQDLTLDGNNFHQPANYVPGNRTGCTIADLRAYAMLTVLPLSPPASSNPLLNGHIYDVQVSYTDANGNENICLGTNIQIPPEPGSYQIQVTFASPPPGSQGQMLYVRDQEVDPIGTTWNYATWAQGADLASAIVWERIPLNRVYLGGENYPIIQHVPALASSNTYPPGLGGIGLASATSQYAIFLDNCSHVTCNRIKILNSTLDGIVLGSADVPHLSPSPPHATTDCQFHDIGIFGCGRGAIGITGPVQRALFERVHCGNCYWGLDIECDAASGAIMDIVFRDCRFFGSWRSPGVQLVAFERSPLLGILFTNCSFDDNMTHIAITEGEVCACITKCQFRNAGYSAIGCNALGRVFIIGNYFEFNGREHPPAPDGHTGEWPFGALLFGTPFLGQPTAIVVSDNIFVGEPDPNATMVTVQSFHSVIIENNDFSVAQKNVCQPIQYVTTAPSLAVLGQAVLLADNRGSYRLV